MENLPYVLLLLACPLGMVAMGAVAWIAGKFTSRQRGEGSTTPAEQLAIETRAAPSQVEPAPVGHERS